MKKTHNKFLIIAGIVGLILSNGLHIGCASDSPEGTGEPELAGCEEGVECPEVGDGGEEGGATGGGGIDTGEEGGETTTPVLGALESRNLMPFDAYSSEVSFGDHSYDWLVNNLLIFFGSIMEEVGMPTSMEANGTGIKMIHRFTSGELRLESATNKGTFWANFVSLPGTGILQGSSGGTVDMIFSTDGTYWYDPQYSVSLAYSLVRFVGTHTDGLLTGQTCVYTPGIHDFNHFNEDGDYVEANRVGQVFIEASDNGGVFTNNTSAQADELREIINCANVGTYTSRYPTAPDFFDVAPVERVMGVVSNIDVNEILE